MQKSFKNARTGPPSIVALPGGASICWQLRVMIARSSSGQIHLPIILGRQGRPCGDSATLSDYFAQCQRIARFDPILCYMTILESIRVY
ncbi:MAG: hypothetical protein R3E02_00480 [Blastomonas sp.]